MVSKSTLILGAIFVVVFALSFVLAVHVSDPQLTSMNESQANLVVNMTINVTSTGVNANITQLNISLPSGFGFAASSNRTELPSSFTWAYGSSNTTVLSWENISKSLVNSTTNRTFTFNISAPPVPGWYNISITSLNWSIGWNNNTYTTNLSIRVNDTTIPSNVAFVSPAADSRTGKEVIVNISVTDNTWITNTSVNITIYLFNASYKLVNYTTFIAAATSGKSYAYINMTNGTTGLVEGTYYINMSAIDADRNVNSSSELRRFILDNTATTVTQTTGNSEHDTTADVTYKVSDDRAGVANCTVYLWKGTDTPSATTNTTSLTADGSTVNTVPFTGLTANTLYYSIVNCTDMAGNTGTSGTASWYTHISDGASTSGGGGTASYWYATYSVTDAQLSAGYSREMADHIRVSLKVSGETHYVGVKGVGAASATIQVSSESQTATINVGETKNFDVNGDNIYDLAVTLSNIVGERANLLIKSVSVQMTAEEIAAATQANNTAPAAGEESTSASEGTPKTQWVIAGAVIIVLAVIAYYVMRRRKMKLLGFC